MEGHLEEEHFEKGKGLFEKGHLEKRQLRKGIVEGQFRKGIMEGQSGGALWKGRKGTVHKLEFIRWSYTRGGETLKVTAGGLTRW